MEIWRVTREPAVNSSRNHGCEVKERGGTVGADGKYEGSFGYCGLVLNKMLCRMVLNVKPGLRMMSWTKIHITQL